MSRALGKHWYNNGTQEGYFEECPEGWVKGRLKVSDETRKKHRENNGMKNLTDEQKENRRQKLILAHKNMTEEQKRHKSEAISKANKGKLSGNIPWNKGKSGLQEAWNKGMHMSEEFSEKIKLGLLNMTEEEKLQHSNNISESKKGKPTWNKGIKTGPWSDEIKKIILDKQYNTKSLNKSFNSSEPEEIYYQFLCSMYHEDDIVRQYSDERYPFICDFYIKSLDLFIELHLSWTHGGHPYDIKSEEDNLLLDYWKYKSETSEYYKNAITTWTVRDPKKLEYLINNKLNYKIYYTIEEALNDQRWTIN